MRKLDTTGTVTSITFPGVGPSPALRVNLRTDDGPLMLTFLGRRDLRCVEIGSRLHVAGTLSSHRGVATVFNPDYLVIPALEGGING
ncbi:MAG: hypothetical protein Q3979_08805 [Actinomycetaceae bacterium]|nr:hypothetical protein [Actinomycetaceae bacterium]